VPSPSPAEPTHYPIRPSRAAIVLLTAIGLVFLIYIAGSALPLALKAVLLVLAAIGLMMEILNASSPRWRTLLVDDDGIGLIGTHAEPFRVERLGPAFASPLFIGLRARSRDGRSVTLGLFRGQISEQGFRSLTIALRNRSNL